MDGFDGTVWSFVYYVNGEIVWKRELDYIDETAELIKIAKFFDKKWM